MCDTHFSIKNIRRVLRIALIFSVVVAFSGCGGGGGGGGGGNSSSPTTNTVAPTATSSSLVTDEDTPTQGTLIANDPKNDKLTYSIVSNGIKGSATITKASKGSFVYTPNKDASGTDTFTFKAKNGSLDSNVSTVTITINAVNDPPLAHGTCATTFQTQTLEGTLAATDLETPHLLTYSLNADGSGGAGPIITSKGAMVTITDPTTGAFTYQPDTEAGDRRGKDSFAFQVSDPDGAVSSSTQTVIVNQTVMPLGDSITVGIIIGTITGAEPPAYTRVGYRKPLYDSLLAAGFTFDLVGAVTDGYGVSNFDYDNEGHGGWTAAEIAWGKNGGYPIDGVRAWLDANPADIILLHIGTNQLTQNTDIDVASILNEIDLWETSASGNHVTVVLALIIDQNPINSDVPVFNSKLLAMVDNRIANGDDIIVVNQHDALTYPDDLADKLHPTTAGYAKMADTWFDALVNVVVKCP
jgi:lysophospholipase L1-like esterase